MVGYKRPHVPADPCAQAEGRSVTRLLLREEPHRGGRNVAEDDYGRSRPAIGKTEHGDRFWLVNQAAGCAFGTDTTTQ